MIERNNMKANDLENRLNSFDLDERMEALAALKDSESSTAQTTENVNMHFHSFYSYNSQGFSPSMIARSAHKARLYAAGLCDFDVLDGQDEFLQTGCMLGLRTTVNLETRAYLKEYADSDINSPGEAGVTYIMGAGFAVDLEKGSPQAQTLTYYRQKAAERNLALIERINAGLAQIAIDYKKDVLPLTPSGSATERHIISAYLNKSKECFETEKLQAFWSETLGVSVEDAGALLNDTPALETAIRNKLAKRGGIGYVQPSEDTFPLVDDFIDWVRSCRAIPMTTWLDGTSDGEADGRAMLECMRDKGAAALNIIPDRNWNIADAETKKIKIENLRSIVQAAAEMNVPINIGTEMNKLGQPFVDDLTGDVLSEFKDDFLKGAQVMVGHTILLKYANFSYVDDKTNSYFNGNLKSQNDFFVAVGALPPLISDVAEKLQKAGPQKAFDVIKESTLNNNWIV